VSQVLPVSLEPGSYSLTITPATSGVPTCDGNGICTSITFCIGTPSTGPARFDVQVDRIGDDAKITIGGQSLALLLHTAVVPATGTISGAARDARGLVVAAAGTLVGSGSSSPAIAASGTIDGQVSVDGGGCSNNGHTWSLSRT
jgi:hypothetical protein